MSGWVGGVGRNAAPVIAVLALACSRPAGSLEAQMDDRAVAEAAATITAADLRVRIGALAHDSMRGRNTPSPELEKAARYVAARFEDFGLLPAEGDAWLQAYPLVITSPGDPADQVLRIDGPDGGPVDPSAFVPLPVGEDLVGEGPIAVTTLGDSATLAGAVAVLRVTQANARQALQGVRSILDRGAVGLLLAVDAGPGYFGGLRRFFEREQLSVGVPDAFQSPTLLVDVAALPSGLAEAVRTGGRADGYGATVRTRARIRREQGFNTIGWIEGSDPELRNEYVIFTAHMDHVGVGRPVDGDSIYNGADDDASGTATIVELAEAFASLATPPRRSLVFMTVSGEEKGLLGSEWYAEHPVFPLESTVADLNIDMIGRNWRDTVVAIGRAESTLGETLETVLGRHPELGLTMIDDPWPEENFYFRSDHYNFARKGVPILFFFTGTHEDYHRPGDEPDRILYEKTSRIGRLIFYLGLEIAGADGRPVWDPESYRRVVEGEGR